MKSLLADLSRREMLRRDGRTLITLERAQDGRALFRGHYLPLFDPGQHLVTTDPETGAEKHYRVVAYDMDSGELDVKVL